MALQMGPVSQQMNLKTIVRILLFLSEALLLHGAWVLHNNYKAAVFPYSTSTNSNSACASLCNADSNCNGYSIDMSNTGCYLSRCDTYSDVPSCSSCYFASKSPLTSSPVCDQETTTPDITVVQSEDTTAADTTTIDSEDTTTTVDIGMSTAGSTEVSTEHSPTASTPPMPSTSGTVQSTGNTSCMCVCENVNMTLEESIDKRKKELIIDKTELSASIRKLTSATDSRVSSKTIGFIGILVMAVFGLLSFCTDISSVLIFLCKRFKRT